MTVEQHEELLRRILAITADVSDTPLPADYPDAAISNAVMRGRVNLADKIDRAIFSARRQAQKET